MMMIRDRSNLGSGLIQTAVAGVNAVMMANAVPLPSVWAAFPSRSRPVLRPVWSRRREFLMERPLADASRLNALVLAVGRTRDAGAFKALFDHFGPRVKGYLMRLGCSPAVAEDLAQEAMLTVWRKAGLFDSEK